MSLIFVCYIFLVDIKGNHFIFPYFYPVLLCCRSIAYFLISLAHCYSQIAKILGIDRLERLKGIPLKLIAIEQFLEEEPSWRGKLVFNMIGTLTSLFIHSPSLSHLSISLFLSISLSTSLSIYLPFSLVLSIFIFLLSLSSSIFYLLSTIFRLIYGEYSILLYTEIAFSLEITEAHLPSCFHPAIFFDFFLSFLTWFPLLFSALFCLNSIRYQCTWEGWWLSTDPTWCEGQKRVSPPSIFTPVTKVFQKHYSVWSCITHFLHFRWQHFECFYSGAGQTH